MAESLGHVYPTELPAGWVTWPVPGSSPLERLRQCQPRYTPPKEGMQTGWRCGDCAEVMAPWVASHTCRRNRAGYLTKTSDAPFGINSTASMAADSADPGDSGRNT